MTSSRRRLSRKKAPLTTREPRYQIVESLRPCANGLRAYLLCGSRENRDQSALLAQPFFCFWLSRYAGFAIDFINNLTGSTPVISSTDKTVIPQTGKRDLTTPYHILVRIDHGSQ